MNPTQTENSQSKISKSSINPAQEALLRAFKDLFQPVLLLTLLAIPAAGIFMMLVGLYFFWTPIRDFFLHFLSDTFFSTAISWTLSWIVSEPNSIFSILVGVMTFLLALPVGFVLVTLIFSIITPLVILKRVHEKKYPHLRRRKNVSLLKSIGNSLFASTVYLILWFLSLPLLLFPPVFLVVSHLLTSYLHAKVFSYDVLSEFVEHDVLLKTRKKYRSSFFSLGALACLILYVPFLNLIGIVYIALSFTHFGLLIVEKDFSATTLPSID